MFKNLKEILKNKVIIVGPYPPPIGGVSINVERIAGLLNEHDITYHIFNHGSYSDKNVTPTNKKYSWWVLFYFKCLLAREGNPVFHFHLFHWFHFIYLLFFSKTISNNLIITIHNEDYFKYGKLKQALTLLLLKNISYMELYSVSHKLNQCFQSHNIKSAFLPAYLPAKDIKQEKISFDKSYKLKIATILGKINDFNIDRYGTDLLFKYIKENYPAVLLYVFVGEDKEYDEGILKKYLSGNMLDSIIIKRGARFVDYINNFDVFVRPNREDGYGISIIEALEQNVPAIASDACIRPKETILFKNGDFYDLQEKLNNQDKARPNLTANNYNDFSEQYIGDIKKYLGS